MKFRKNIFSCLDCAMQEVQNSEQTQELKLPDSMPDIGRILSAWGQVILRGKEWRSDEISSSAGLMVWVLYAPEDGSEERCIEGWIPFQMKWDLPTLTREGDIRILCLPRFVDARSVSPRKILVRAGVAAMAQAYVPMEAEVFAPDAMPEYVQLLQNNYPVQLPMEAGEKTFLLEDDLTLPPSAPQPEKLLYYTLSPRISEQKVLTNKLVFRGNGNLHVLYRSEEGQIHGWDFEIPFSQYAELSADHSADAQAEVLPAVTSLELDIDDEGKLRLKVGVVAQYLIWDKQMVSVIEDAYAPGRELQIHTEELELPVVLERRRENIYGEQTIPADANGAADIQFLPDFPRQRRREDDVEMVLPGNFQLLYYGENGALNGASARWEGQYGMKADQSDTIAAVPMPPQNLQSVPGDGTVTARAELPVDVTSTVRQRIPMVAALELGEAVQPDAGRPSLILRRAGNDRLWDIAKGSGSTMEAIRRANHLEEEPKPDQMLLIPVS